MIPVVAEPYSINSDDQLKIYPQDLHVSLDEMQVLPCPGGPIRTRAAFRLLLFYELFGSVGVWPLSSSSSRGSVK